WRTPDLGRRSYDADDADTLVRVAENWRGERVDPEPHLVTGLFEEALPDQIETSLDRRAAGERMRGEGHELLCQYAPASRLVGKRQGNASLGGAVRRWPVAGMRGDRQPVTVLHAREYDWLAVARNRQQGSLPGEVAQLDEERRSDEAQVELLEGRLSEGEELAAQAVATAARVLEDDAEPLHGRQMAINARLELPHLGGQARQADGSLRI